MNRMMDPFPPTPEAFHRRVEATLQGLATRKRHAPRTFILAAVIAALVTATGVAAVVSHSGFKRELADVGAIEVAELVEEPHIESAGEGFAFSIDEIIWEGGDLYISYSISVPGNGNYLVAMDNPTLNGERLTYDAKGWTTPKFIDGNKPVVLLMGGDHGAACSELWTFAVDSRLKQRTDNHLAFKAALYRTDQSLEGVSDWTDMLSPPDSLSDDVPAVIERAEYLAERVIQMDLDAAALQAVVFNDVTEHDFDVEDYHIHVDRFRMTHLGVSIEYTLSIPGATQQDQDAMARYRALIGDEWRFILPGYSLGATGSASMETLSDSAVLYRCAYSDSAVLPLKDLESVTFGNSERTVALTPICNPDIADVTPKPVIEHGEDISN